MTIRDAYSLWSTTYDSDRNLTRDLDQLATASSLGNRSYLNVIEIGCGTGKNTAFLARIARTIMAIDFSTGMLRQAKLKVDSDNVGFVVADLTNPWPCKQNSFELIVCNLVLEHVEHLGPIFYEASQALVNEGLFFISELHPFRQYKGTQANFQRGDQMTEIPAYVHHLSDFTDPAEQNGFSLRVMKEWWDDEDHAKLPRLISFTFEKRPQKGT